MKTFFNLRRIRSPVTKFVSNNFLYKYGIRINRDAPYRGIGNLKVLKFDTVLVNQEGIDIEKEIT